MASLIVRTHASAPATLIPDEGVTVPGAGTSLTFTDIGRLRRLRYSRSLRELCTDDAYGVGQSTLILNDGVSDVVQADVDQFLSDIFRSVFTSTFQGIVPASGGGTANYLRADGTWSTPPGGGGGGGDPVNASARDSMTRTLIYIGRSSAPAGSENPAVAEWQIYRYDSALTPMVQLYADGNTAYDNIWNNRESLSYS